MMNAATGVCKCVRMNPDGSTEEIDLDMTPSQRKAAKRRRRRGHLWPVGPLGVSLVARRDADESTETFQGTATEALRCLQGRVPR